ncbi:hypothetical protein ACFV1W_29490 [Kitasatospora sp. NPDC059648]|uniref:hypothetical protein n=1 Tax=Kitasatospora sp. NPDC059648 TaxID=3346894 RepID=UPI0036C517B6
MRFEVFSMGADGGIDLRHQSADRDLIIIQCKHWMKSGRAKLISVWADLSYLRSLKCGRIDIFWRQRPRWLPPPKIP